MEELLNVSVEFVEGQPQPSPMCEVNVAKGGACKQPTRGVNYQPKACFFPPFFWMFFFSFLFFSFFFFYFFINKFYVTQPDKRWW